MLVYDYDQDLLPSGRVVVQSDPQVLIPVAREEAGQTELLVWRNALFDTAINDAFERPDWPIRLFKGMSAREHWIWIEGVGTPRPISSSTEALERITAAAGTGRPAEGNILLTVPIRDPQDRTDTTLGGSDWWHSRLALINDSDPFPVCLILRLIEILQKLELAGSSTCIDRISIVLNKDIDRSVCSIAPVLHSDRYYGLWEAAIASILEADLNPYGGTLFLPGARMSDLTATPQLDVNSLDHELHNLPCLVPCSGDLMMHSGMLNSVGTAKLDRGIPHMSADVPGRSARLLIVGRNSIPRKTATPGQ